MFKIGLLGDVYGLHGQGTSSLWSRAGAHGGFRGAVPLPAFRLSGEALREGDGVTVTYGDTSAGGAGMRVGPFSNDAVLLPLYVDHGGGLFHEVPSPTFRVVGGPVAGVHGFNPSIVGTCEPVTLSVRAEDAAYSRATGPIPAWQVSLNGGVFRDIEAANSDAGDNYAGAIARAIGTRSACVVFQTSFATTSLSSGAIPIPGRVVTGTTSACARSTARRRVPARGGSAARRRGRTEARTRAAARS